MTDLEPNPDNIRSGPIRHDSLSDEMLEQVRSILMDYHKQHLGDELLPDEGEKKLLAALIAISSGVEDVEALGVPAEVGRKLLACYDALGGESECTRCPVCVLQFPAVQPADESLRMEMRTTVVFEPTTGWLGDTRLPEPTSDGNGRPSFVAFFG